MSSKRVNADKRVRREHHAISRRLILGVLGVSATNFACSSTASTKLNSSKRKQHVDAVELFPADLDLVMRVDLARMRVALGPLANGLSSRVGSEIDAHDELAAKAIERARVAWVGTRLGDFEVGDRVLVIEGDVEDLRPDPSLFQVLDPPLSDDLKTFERRGPTARDTTARIHLLGPRTIMFVSSVEVDGVERVLLRGGDPGRRDPPAEGLMSADLRGRRLPAGLERRFPSIAAIVRGVNRARASINVVDEALRADIDITAASEGACTKLEGFLSALREGGQGSRYALLFEVLRIERLEKTVRVSWQVPLEMLRKFVDG